MIPCELNPAPTKRPDTSGVSPRQKFTSGVNDSGAQRKRSYVLSRSAGIARSAASRTGAKCSQSGSNSPKAKSAPIPVVSRGFPLGSKAPTTRDPRWWRT